MSPPSVSKLTAVVTGPTAGIGRAFAEQLAQRGHPLLLVSRDGRRLEALAKELSGAHGVEARALAADLSLDDGIERVFAALSAMPGIGVLVNNAGFGTIGKLLREDSETQVRMVRLHALAPMRLIQAVLPSMASRGSGWIINVSSIAAFVYSPGNANYSATKAYLTRLTQVLSTELVGTGVVVQSLCPGFTHTEFHKRAQMDMTHVPRWMWLNADRVVRESIAAAERGRPVVVIPGLRYRLITGLVRMIPHGLLHYAGHLTRRGR